MCFPAELIIFLGQGPPGASLELPHLLPLWLTLLSAFNKHCGSFYFILLKYTGTTFRVGNSYVFSFIFLTIFY